MRQISADQKMPAKSTIFLWLANHQEFSDQYAQAMEWRAQDMADETLEIADDGTNDWIEKENQQGQTYVALDSEHVQRSRIRIDTRKWLMSKMMPKKYGDKLVQEHTGPDGGPIQTENTFVFNPVGSSD